MFVELGLVLILIGTIWLVILSVQTAATKTGKILWTIANIFFNPLAGIIFFVVNKIGFVPMLLTIIGSVLMGYGLTETAGNG